MRWLSGWLGAMLLVLFLCLGDVITVAIGTAFGFVTVHFVLAPLFAVSHLATTALVVFRGKSMAWRMQQASSAVVSLFVLSVTITGDPWLVEFLGLRFHK